MVTCPLGGSVNPLFLFDMLQQGTIFNLQSVKLPEWSEARCLRSELTEYSTKKSSSELSLKLVREGEEQYCIDGVNYRLKANDILLVNSGESIETLVDSKATTTGICIYPPKSLISEAILSHTINWDDANTLLDNTHVTTHSFRMKSGKNMGRFIQKHLPQLEDGSLKSASWWLEFYVSLAEQIALDQNEVEQRMGRIQAVKKQTREELYRRLSVARDYIHDHQFDSIGIDELARLTMMSKFHFLRSFKAMFSTSPYGYLLELKLEAAQELISKGYSMKETAELVGYSDPKNLRKNLQLLESQTIRNKENTKRSGFQ